jgi:hypothetical protein
MVVVAESFFQRLKGLSFTRTLDPDTAWVFPRCQIVHMFFMQYPLGLIYLDRNKIVVRVVERIDPWRIAPYVREAYYVVEVVPEKTRGLRVGARWGF